MSLDEPQSVTERRTTIGDRHEEAAEEVLPDHRGLYIGGEWVASESGETFETHDPTTGTVLAEVAAAKEGDVDRAVQAAWRCFDEEFGEWAPAERQELLHEMADCIEAFDEEFAKLESLDNGKPIAEARQDIELVVDHLRYFGGIARAHEGGTLETQEQRYVQTYKEPYGVVGQIIPWNFPLLMAAWKLGPALAAGNAVVLKPAEETPLSVLRLMELVDDFLPAGLVNVVPGHGTEAGEALAGNEDVRKLAFTGSGEVGTEVMKQAAESITDITLELGGKSPLVVYPDVDIEEAVETTVSAIFYNTGECCSAGSRLFVHEDIREEFLDCLIEAGHDLEIGDPLLESTELGPKVSGEQWERTMGYLEYARSSDAEFLMGGERPDDEALVDGHFIEPTLIDDIEHSNKAVQEEIFGPVLEVFTWEEYDEMIELANDVEYGLAAGILTDDIAQADRTGRDLEAGTIWVNDYNDIRAGAAFGGYKQSGIGRETAQEAIEYYSQTKTMNISY